MRLIDADELKKDLEDQLQKLFYGEEDDYVEWFVKKDTFYIEAMCRRFIEVFVKLLYSCPTVEPDQKPACEIEKYIESCDDCGFCGQWLEKNIVMMDDELDDRNVIDAWQSARCSNCGKYHTTPFRYSFNHYEFCPRCGKPMKE